MSSSRRRKLGSGPPGGPTLSAPAPVVTADDPDGNDGSALPIFDLDDPAFEAHLQEQVQEALDGPGPDLTADEVFGPIEERYREHMRAAGREP